MKKSRGLLLWIGILLTAFLAASVIALRGKPDTVRAGPASSPSSHIFQISWFTSNECHRYHARASLNTNHHEYLVVWDNAWSDDFKDIYAQRLTTAGEQKSGFTVATGANGDERIRFYPDLAYNNWTDEYLVVYMLDALGDGIHYEIWGRRVSWNGSWMGPEFQIFSWPHRAFWRPRVVLSKAYGRYLVVADALDTTTGLWNDVAGRLVYADGSMPYAGHSISTQNQALQPQHADQAYNWPNTEFLVVWRQNYSGEDWDIWGARVDDFNGAVVDPPGLFIIDRASTNQDFPAVAFDDDDRYQVVWQQGNSLPLEDWEIYGRELDQDGVSVGDRFPIGNNPGNQLLPDVDIRLYTGKRIAAWLWEQSAGSYQLWGLYWDSPWDPGIYQPPGQFAASVSQSPPAIASSPDGELIVYSRLMMPDIGHIFGWLIYSTEIYLPLVRL